MRKKFTDCVDIVGSPCENFESTKFYISTGAVDEDDINEYGIEVINFEEKPSRANLVVKSDDIIFAKMQATKKTLLINEEFAEYVYSTGFCAVHAKKNILTRDCLLYLLMSKAFLNQKDKNCSGATQKAITNAGLQKIIVNIPDYKLQDDISKRLSILLKVINMRKNELDMLDDLIKARFVEMFGACKNMLSMNELCSVITDGTHQPPKFQKSGIPFIFVSNLANNTVTYDTEKFISQETYSELYKRTPIEIGDLLLSTVGSYGHPAVVVEDKKFLFQRHIAYLKPKCNIVNSFYLHSALLAPDGQRQIEGKVKGIAQKTLNLSEIKKIVVPIPPIEEQNEFERFVHQVDKSKVVVQKSLDETQMLFDSLMQKYFG